MEQNYRKWWLFNEKLVKPPVALGGGGGGRGFKIYFLILFIRQVSYHVCR